MLTRDGSESKLRLAAPLPGKKAQDVKQAALTLAQPIERFVKTITFDNGKEFSQHEAIAKALGCDTFFARPYHSWEREHIENANGLLRQYFPKTMGLANVAMKQVFQAVDKLNSRPRKCLGFKTPNEVIEELTSVNVRNLMGYALIA